MENFKSFDIVSVELQQLSETQSQLATTGSYALCSNLLPSHISLKVAEKILFVGESVHMFDKRNAGNQFGKISEILL